MTDAERNETNMVLLLAGRIGSDYPCRPIASRMRTARHEATHAVLSFLFGLPFLYVTIMPEQGSPGHLQPLKSDRPTSPAVSEFVERVLRGRLSDRRRVVFVLFLEPGATWQTVRRECRRLEAKARGLVETHWLLIRDLAEELLQRSRLTGVEVESFLRSAQAFRARRRLVAAECEPPRHTRQSGQQ